MARALVTRRRVTAGEALYVVERLLRERRLKANEVARLVAEMHREIDELEQRLAVLREATRSRRPSQAGATSQSKSGSSGRTPRGDVTPELAKSRRLQGEYMGLIRHVQGAARARMKKLAAHQGREAAIKAMRASLTK